MTDLQEELQPAQVAQIVKAVLKKTWTGIPAVFRVLLLVMSLLFYLNIFAYIWYFLCRLFWGKQLRKSSYGYGEHVVYSGSFSQKLGHLLRTEQNNRRRLLNWVQEQIPNRKVLDLNRSWSNGISLCALIEALVPDTCPRYDLLSPDTRVNNCRLGMKLVQKSLGIEEPMLPEVMADPCRIQDKEMKKYLLSIQYGSETPLEVPEVSIKIPDASGQITLEEKAECTANGSGLLFAVVNKKARFNITTQTYKSKHLTVDICGPSGEILKKKLVDNLRGSRQSSKNETVDGNDIVRFDYQCVKSGSYQVNYIPRVVGIFKISITWGEEHINNSPYNIRATLPKGAEAPLSYKTKTVSFQDDKSPVVEDTLLYKRANTQHPASLANAGRRQSLVRQPHVTKRGDSSESSGSGTLSTLSSINSSIATSVDKSIDISDTQVPSQMRHPHIGHRQASPVNTSISSGGSLLTRSSSVMYGTTDGPARVRTKRKVLRRIIKGAGGKEELIHYPQEQKQTAQSITKSNNSGKSSSRSTSPLIETVAASPQHSQLEKVTGRFGERMSKIILGRALYEVSKRVIMNKTSKNKIFNGQSILNQSKANSKPVDVLKKQDTQNTRHDKLKLEPPSGPNDSQYATILINTTLKEPQTRSEGKALADLQQATQEFSPQMSRDSDTSNSEREGPLGQEASEQTAIGHKCPKSSVVIDIASTVTHARVMSHIGTVNRNGPDGQERGHNEEYLASSTCGKKDSTSRSESWEAKTQQPKVTKNTNNVTSDVKEINENITPLKNMQKVKNIRSKITAGEIFKEEKFDQISTSVAASSNDTQLIKSPTGHQPGLFKVKRLPANRPRAEKETQCSAQGIKDETGWVSRRTVYRNKQKKDADNDSALGESRGSSMLVSKTDSRDVGNWKSEERDSKIAKTCEDFLTSTKANQHFQMNPFRPNIPSYSAFLARQRPRTIARQTTFDSGFSDEQRSSREHSNFHSRLPSASSTHSATANPPLGNELKTTTSIEQLEQGHAVQDTAVIRHTVVRPTLSLPSDNSLRRSESRSFVNPPKVDMSILPNSYPDTNSCPSPKTFRNDFGSLTVGNAMMISSTSPTFGNSPLPSPGQYSTSTQSSKSPSPNGDKSEIFSSLDTSTSAFAGLSVRDIGEKLVSGDISLDTLLQSLEHDPEYSTREFLRKYRPAMQMNIMESLPDPNMEPESIDGGITSNLERTKSTYSSGLIADRCHASGAGLYQGLVNSKNNFQVQTDNAGDGSLGVSICGPKPHTVVESNIVYTGDDFYEVIYEVNLPGFYVISVKWGDRHIIDSPFIVKVSF